jgi:hypothetical protein
MPKTEEEYADILVQLMEVNSNMELATPLHVVLAEIVIPKFQEQTVQQAMQIIAEGGEPISTMMAIPIASSVMMFQLGVLYGRNEAANLLNSE